MREPHVEDLVGLKGGLKSARYCNFKDDLKNFDELRFAILLMILLVNVSLLVVYNRNVCFGSHLK